MNRDSIWYRYRWFWIPPAAGLVLWGVWVGSKARYHDQVAWCKAEYAKATTAADSARVDRSYTGFMVSIADPGPRCIVLKDVEES
ncbi:MAG TPA: hypothetical protein PLL69_09400 [Gemmatimonadales bacterium]|nr:hypothetical protein [Gemmatimonadales bacterium]